MTAALEANLRTHTFRRLQVARLIAQGEYPEMIADRLGHTSVHTVLEVYGRVYEAADEVAADGLEAQISSCRQTASTLGAGIHEL